MSYPQALAVLTFEPRFLIFILKDVNTYSGVLLGFGYPPYPPNLMEDIFYQVFQGHQDVLCMHSIERESYRNAHLNKLKARLAPSTVPVILAINPADRRTIIKMSQRGRLLDKPGKSRLWRPL